MEISSSTLANMQDDALEVESNILVVEKLRSVEKNVWDTLLNHFQIFPS
jgi:hypothetical protein